MTYLAPFHRVFQGMPRGLCLSLFLLAQAQVGVAQIATATTNFSAKSPDDIRNFIRANPASESLQGAVSALYAKVLAANSIEAFTDFVLEFPDFPEADQAKMARFKKSGLESRFAFREGKIGERYVPAFSNSRYSTEYYTVNGQTYTESRRVGDSTGGGYNEGRYGFTAVYQLFNESRQPYVVRVRLSGSSSVSEKYVDTSWGGEKSHGTKTNSQQLSKEVSYLLDAGSEVKDQIVAGETKPNDFALEFVDFTPVTPVWVAGLRKALDGQADLKQIGVYLTDAKAQGWHANLRERFTEVARKLVSVQIAAGKRFDPDFDSPVTITLTNRSGMPLQVRVKPNFGSAEGVKLSVGESKVVTTNARGIAKDSLRVELLSFEVPESRLAPVADDKLARFAAGVATRASEKNARMIIENIDINMVVIPAGSFVMGSSAAEQELAKDFVSRESPQHRVNIPSFAAGQYAVTRGEFAAFVRAKGYQTEAEKGDGCFVYTTTRREKQADKNWRNAGFTQANDHPVVCVSWNDAQAYAKWVSEKSGKTYRLLSEAEREYAARAGTQTAFWWGDSINADQANYAGKGTPYNGSPKGPWRKATVAVSSFASNGFGLYNMHGNVWEWVQDVYHENYNGAPTDGSAWMSGGNQDSRVLRGGSWLNGAVNLRSAYRGNFSPDVRFVDLGFRLARTVP